MSNQSSEVTELHKALAAAQGSMKAAIFNCINPHFKSKYANLAAIWDAIREPLSKYGLSITQTTETITSINGTDRALMLVTTLRHASGQWVSSWLPLPITSRPHEFGSAFTYARRYSLSGIVGIAADEDDDANAAQKANGKRENPNVNKPEDFIDKAQYAEDGTPINNIPFGNSELRKLSKKDAEIEYNNLLIKMKYQTTREAMMVWGKSIADNVQTLPDLYQVQLREEFADRLNELP